MVPAQQGVGAESVVVHLHGVGLAALGLEIAQESGVVQNLRFSGDTGVRRPRPVRAGLRLAGWVLCGRRTASPGQARWG